MAEEIGRLVVLQKGRHDLEDSPVVSHPNARPLGERVHQPGVCLPVRVWYRNDLARGSTGPNAHRCGSSGRSGTRSPKSVYSLRILVALTLECRSYARP